jgi:hypothetical protein
MLSIQVSGLKEVLADLRDMSERRVKAAAATALTRTAREVEKRWQTDIRTSIDRPTKRTLESTVVRQATAQRLVAEVKLKDSVSRGQSPAEYLAPHETGSQRFLKKFERALVASGAMPSGYFVVPGKAAVLDGYGNVSRAQIVQVIAQLGAEYSPGYQRVISKNTQKRMARAARLGRAYVAVQPGTDAKRQRVSPGIYERMANGDRKAVFLFKRSVTYRRRLSLIQLAEKEASQMVQREFTRAIDESRAKMLAKG